MKCPQLFFHEKRNGTLLKNKYISLKNKLVQIENGTFYIKGYMLECLEPIIEANTLPGVREIVEKPTLIEEFPQTIVPVQIGEHPQIMEELRKQIEELAFANDCISNIDNLLQKWS